MRYSNTKPRPIAYLMAPVQQGWRGLSDLAAHPLAFVGGMLSMALAVAAMAALLLGWEADAHAESTELDFEAGSLMPLGHADAPDLVLASDMTSIDELLVDPPIDTVTAEESEPTPDDSTITPPEPSADPLQPKPQPRPKPKPKPKPEPEPEPQAQSKGDPFGDPEGWDELRRDGDPWATAVIGRLNGLRYPAWAGEHSSGTFGFKLQICRDGAVGSVLVRRSTGDARLDRAMKTEIERTRFAAPPTELLRQMKGRCTFVKHDFAWSANGRVR